MHDRTTLWDFTQLCDYLLAEGISCDRLDHPPVYTAGEAERLVPKARGAHAKNLLLEDRRDGRLFMLTVPFGVRVDLACMASVLGANKLRFASVEVMQATLGVTPGAVSILALINDRAGRVTLVLDQSLAVAAALQCHPLVNTTTLIINQRDLRCFLSAIAHEPKVLAVPLR